MISLLLEFADDQDSHEATFAGTTAFAVSGSMNFVPENTPDTATTTPNRNVGMSIQGCTPRRLTPLTPSVFFSHAGGALAACPFCVMPLGGESREEEDETLAFRLGESIFITELDVRRR